MRWTAAISGGGGGGERERRAANGIKSDKKGEETKEASVLK